MFFFRQLLILTSILVSFVIAGCGQKGALYLPKDKPENAAKPAHIKQAHRAVASSKKQKEPLKTASVSKLDEAKPAADTSLTSNAVKPELKTNSGTINVSGS